MNIKKQLSRRYLFSILIRSKYENSLKTQLKSSFSHVGHLMQMHNKKIITLCICIRKFRTVKTEY
nr:MAG TPA: hypothetical protein [Caudoviricetes sp.]